MSAPNFGEVADRLRKATVRVDTAHGPSTGSGVIWSADGTIVTNAHVAPAERAIVTLWDGRAVDARTVSRDPRRDIAALRLPQDQLPAARFRDSGTVMAGEVVVAVGNPMGFVGALSTGVVHGVGPYPGLGRKPWIQAAVRLAPGNSGGPLSDAEGNVIGINTMVANGLGLAVPSTAIAEFMERGASGSVELGVTVRPVPVRSGRRPGVGLLVLAVGRNSPAEAASLKPGDLLVGIDGRRIESLDDVPDALETARSPIKVEFVRPPRTGVRETTVALSERTPVAV